MKKGKKDINWRNVTSHRTLAHQLMAISIFLGDTPKKTHIINWCTDANNAALIESTWNDWRSEFPDALHQNLLRNSKRYNKKVERERKNAQNNGQIKKWNKYIRKKQVAK